MGYADILILGIGNLLWADEGFGVRVADELHRRYHLPPRVRVLDGGTQGLYLVQFVTACRRLIVFDAIDYGLEPGELRLVRGDEVPRFTGIRKMSLHQTGFQEVLSAADLLGHYPEDMLLVGVQAADLENWGGSLSDPVRARIDPAIAAAVAQLAEWGVTVRPRASRLPAQDGLMERSLSIAAYEGHSVPATD